MEKDYKESQLADALTELDQIQVNIFFAIHFPLFRIRNRVRIRRIRGMFLGLSDPDPLVRGTDPRIRIRTKMSRLRNTAAFLGGVAG